MLTVLLNTVNEEVTFEYWCKLNEYIARNATDKALEAFTWGARGQFFWDGNKRTSLLLANQF